MTEPVLLYHAGNQAGRFRFLLWFSAACCLAAVAGFFPLVREPDGGWLLALIVLALGVAFFGGMLVYASHYVLWLWATPDLGAVEIETMALIGARERRHPVADLLGAEHKSGELYTGKHYVRTPFLKLRVRGRRLPYVVDLQGRLEDEDRFGRLLAGLAKR